MDGHGIRWEAVGKRVGLHYSANRDWKMRNHWGIRVSGPQKSRKMRSSCEGPASSLSDMSRHEIRSVATGAAINRAGDEVLLPEVRAKHALPGVPDSMNRLISGGLGVWGRPFPRGLESNLDDFPRGALPFVFLQ